MCHYKFICSAYVAHNATSFESGHELQLSELKFHSKTAEIKWLTFSSDSFIENNEYKSNVFSKQRLSGDKGGFYFF